MSRVSVVIPTFNRASLLSRALDSVATQTYKDWELIVVDDGSTDGTEAAYQGWLARHSFAQTARYIRTANLGVSHARNLGALVAESPWLAFLDSDDEWLPEKLEAQMALTHQFSLIHSDEIWIRHGRRVNPMRKHFKCGGRIFDRCVELCCISPSTALIERDLFRNLGGFREDFPVCEDYELWLRVAARFAIGFVARPLIVKHGGHADQLSRKFIGMDYYRIKALRPFLSDQALHPFQRAHVARTMIEKSDILLNGYQKHGNLDHVSEVQTWREAALIALTAIHNAHSATERFPRSESRASL